MAPNTHRLETQALTLPSTGRCYWYATHVLLADADPSGRARLDGIARILHDAAILDNDDAPTKDKGPWVLRGFVMRVRRLPQYLETLDVPTWCSGLGRAWAARASELRANDESLVVAEAIWVQLDAATGRPRRLTEEFLECFGPSALGRHVPPRLGLQPPEHAPDVVLSVPLRHADLDIIGHVNNAVYLRLIDELRSTSGDAVVPEPCTFAIEFYDGLSWPGTAEVERYTGTAERYCIRQEGRLAAMASLAPDPASHQR